MRRFRARRRAGLRGGKSRGSSSRWSARAPSAMTMNRIIDLRYDRENPRTAHARPRHRRAVRELRVGVRRRGCRRAGDRGVAIESAGARTFARRARRPVFLFLHQAVHVVVAPGAGILPGNVARGGVDRHRRLARRAHADPLRGGDAVGRRLRRALRLPGPRVRQVGRISFPCPSVSASRARWPSRAPCTS